MLILNENNTVTILHEMLLIPAYKKIWDSDKDVNKVTALSYFSYIYFKHDLKSKYRNNYSGDELEEKIKIDLFENKKIKLPEYIKDAEAKYIELQSSKALKMLLSAESALEQITSYFDNFKITDIKIDDRADSINKLMRNLKEVDDVTEKIEAAKKRIESELFVNNQSKKRKLGKFEIPD